MPSSPHARNAVREVRLARGLTQAELAKAAGISRTAVTAVEAGRLAPSVHAAMALAGVLGESVETLFGPKREEGGPQWSWTPPQPEWRCWHAEIGGRPWRVPVEETAAASTSHDAIGGALIEFDWRTARDTLVVASCDPAASLMAAEYHTATGKRMIVVRRSSRQALELLKAGRVHVAGIHLGTHGNKDENLSIAAEVLGVGFELVRGASWTAGVAMGDRVAGQSFRRLKEDGVRWVGREQGSGARQCLDDLLGKQRKYRHLARDHRGVVDAIRSGWADAGVCVELSSAEAGLSFHSVRQEDYDLCYPQAAGDDARIRGLIDLVRSSRFRKLLGELPGYDARETGERVGES